jgi:hypothetical protein
MFLSFGKSKKKVNFINKCRYFIFMIIKKIFDKEFDEEVHSHFVKFSRGEFKNKYLVDGKKQATKWAIKTGPEYVNYFVKSGLSSIQGEIAVKGIIISTLDLSSEIKFDIEKVSNFQGVKKNIINTTINPQDVIELIDKYPKVFFALSFKTADTDIKIKAKPPKSGKPGKGDEEVKADFCTIKTNNSEVIRDLFFDVGLNWKIVSINHTLDVNGIVYPGDMTGLKPAEIREQSKRKGIIKRRIIADGQEKTTEAEFVA